MRLEGKLTNSNGEFIASGPCEVNRERGEVTMWPSWEMHMLERERGPLALLGRATLGDRRNRRGDTSGRSDSAVGLS